MWLTGDRNLPSSSQLLRPKALRSLRMRRDMTSSGTSWPWSIQDFNNRPSSETHTQTNKDGEWMPVILRKVILITWNLFYKSWFYFQKSLEYFSFNVIDIIVAIVELHKLMECVLCILCHIFFAAKLPNGTFKGIIWVIWILRHEIPSSYYFHFNWSKSSWRKEFPDMPGRKDQRDGAKGKTDYKTWVKISCYVKELTRILHRKELLVLFCLARTFTQITLRFLGE